MKKIIFLILKGITAATMVAQTSVLQPGRKAYNAKFIMPNLSVQNVAVIGDKNDMEQFLKIVSNNMANTQPIILNEKFIQTGSSFDCKNQSYLTESQVYRFLSNQLCETCSCKKVFDKNIGAFLLLKTDNQQKYMLAVYYSDIYKRWAISIFSFFDDNKVFTVTKDRKLFYL